MAERTIDTQAGDEKAGPAEKYLKVIKTGDIVGYDERMAARTDIYRPCTIDGTDLEPEKHDVDTVLVEARVPVSQDTGTATEETKGYVGGTDASGRTEGGVGDGDPPQTAGEAATEAGTQEGVLHAREPKPVGRRKIDKSE